MKENLELEKQDLAIDHDIQVSSDDPKVIDFLLETWFDVDKKFGINIAEEDGTWLNMWGLYNPFEDTLKIQCQIVRDNMEEEWFDYEPTEGETQLIKDMLSKKIQRRYDQTPQEFCEEAMDEPMEMGGMT